MFIHSILTIGVDVEAKLCAMYPTQSAMISAALANPSGAAYCALHSFWLALICCCCLIAMRVYMTQLQRLMTYVSPGTLTIPVPKAGPSAEEDQCSRARRDCTLLVCMPGPEC